MAVKRLFLVAVMSSVLVGPAMAGPIPDREIPGPLLPWKDWVLRGHEDARCPFLHGSDQRQCAWPSRLELELAGDGGRFTQSWQVLREMLVPLPGDARRWPQEVTVDGRPAPVVTQAGQPSVQVAAGEHSIRGTFRWKTLPELLPIPPATGLVGLRIGDQEVPFPNREPDGQLWLRRAEREPEEARLEIVTHRRIVDEVPLQLLTRVELRVSGKSREVELGRSLPDGFVPMSLESPLPARLEADGSSLRVQVRPGRWTLELVARHEGPAAEIAAPSLAPPWEAEEVWVFEARPNLRMTAIEGVPAVDPQRTELPPDWRGFPAYLVRAGDRMQLVEKRRGDADPAPDRLTLGRTWWLDFDGGGFTFHDALGGTLSRSWRLVMDPPTELGHVAVDGEDQLITRLEDDARAGVEIRRSEVSVAADGRLGRTSGKLPAVGWDHDVQDLAIELRLPPGWRLFGARGIDDVSSSWLTDWTLLDLFLVLVTAMAVARLFGWSWGALALVTLALLWREHDAPKVIWLVMLAGVALVRAVPAGRFAGLARLWYLGSLLALVLVTVPFLIQQVRHGLWPALEPPRVTAVAPQTVTGMLAPAERVAGELADAIEDKTLRAMGSLDRFQLEAAAPAARPAPVEKGLPRLDPDAIVQTGPGLPRWSWSSVRLGWKGPVDRGHEISLLLVSPQVNLVLALLRVALIVGLFVRVAQPAMSALASRASTGAAAAALLLTLLVPSPARADFPPPELLDDLRARLLEKPDCHPECAAISRMALEAGADSLRLRLEIDAAAAIGIPLPGGRNWTPRTVRLDGEPAVGLARRDDGSLWLDVPEGRHQAVLEGMLPSADRVDLPLPLQPRLVEATLEGWELSGLVDGVPGDTLQLARLAPRGEVTDELRPTQLLPFVQIERTLRLGLSPEAHTFVRRLTPAGQAIVLDVPLLPGESITTDDVPVENGRARVTLGPGVGYVAWRSILERTGTIALEAPQGVGWTEIWRVEASPIWHVEAEGTPEIHQPPHVGPRTREWHPWPGETVSLSITRPEAVTGQTLTIDRAALDTTPGRRATDATLVLELRSSRGGRHPVTLPDGADLQSVKIDGLQQPIRAEGRVVTLPIRPGPQTAEITWREPRGIGARFVSGELDLGVAAVNPEIRVRLPRERWTLFLGGGLLGPAVLFWSTLVVLLLVAVALGRVTWTPLRARHWFLLGIGLSQVSIVTAATIAGWLLALGWRRSRGSSLSDRPFDLLQIALAVWTLVALSGLVSSIEQGLLGLPEMQITGNGSTAWDLRWTFDRSGAALPQVWLVSVPLLGYRLAMLAWALWLAWAFVGWIRWAWACFNEGGLWRPLPLRRKQVAG